MEYKIYICNIDRSQVWELPVIPRVMPKIVRASKNETFETFSNGDFNFIGSVGLAEFQLDCWLPAKGKTYYFQNGRYFDSDNFIYFLDVERLYKRPIRAIFARSDGTNVLNDLFSIESLEWNENNVGDYEYSLKCKQWREIL